MGRGGGGREIGLLANLYISKDFVICQAETLQTSPQTPCQSEAGEELESAASRLLN